MPNISFKKAKIGAPDISFGTGTFVRQKSDGTYMNVNQVNAASIPIIDSGAHYPNDRVEYALGYVATRINVISASWTTRVNAISASHTTQGATVNSLVKYWWKSPRGTIYNSSNTRIFVPADYYPIGGKLYNWPGGYWSTQRQSATYSQGFDYATTNGAGWRKGNAWNYLYGVAYANSMYLVAATKAPTAKYDTDITSRAGSTTIYDTNVYLTSFRTSYAASNIVHFIQEGNNNRIGYDVGLSCVDKMFFSATNNVQLPVVLRVPNVTNYAYISADYNCTTGATTPLLTIGGTADNLNKTIDRTATTDPNGNWIKTLAWLPLKSSTTNLFYYKRVGYRAQASIIINTTGWVDKWC